MSDPSSNRYMDLVQAWLDRLPGQPPARRILVVDADARDDQGRPRQALGVLEDGVLQAEYLVSTARKGLGSQNGSEMTPVGWHAVQDILGWREDCPVWTSFEAKAPHGRWNGKSTNPALMLTRILVLQGLEPGVNQGGSLDTYARCIYIHGTNVTGNLGRPDSHGCVRMDPVLVKDLAAWVAQKWVKDRDVVGDDEVHVLIAGTPA